MTEKPVRRSREEIRRLLLGIGGAIVREEGVGSLTFRHVFRRLEEETGTRITNGSVIGRVWENQADFRADVLVALALEENENEVGRTVSAVSPALTDIDLSSPEARHRALRELCRLGGAANLRVMREGGNWPMWIGAWQLALDPDSPDHQKRIQTALVDGQDAFNEKIEEVYLGVADALGFRVRPPLTLRQFTVAADVLGQGIGLRDQFDSRHMDSIWLPTGLNGEEQEWTLFAIGFESLVRQFFEIDPDWRPPGQDAGP
jgi:hypothetical protein